MVKKHQVKVELSTLHKTPIEPPRKRWWDLLPQWLCLFIIRLGLNPKPTPHEMWIINNAHLRAFYKGFYDALHRPQEVEEQAPRAIAPMDLN